MRSQCGAAVMKKLDKRGVAALEFCLVAAPVFILMFAIFDLGRYAITIQSLQMLSGAGVRQCYINGLATCTTDPLPSDAAKQAVAPFLYAGGLKPLCLWSGHRPLPPPIF